MARPKPRTSRRLPAGWSPWLAAVVSAWPFLPALGGGFLDWDDAFLIADNPRIRAFTLENLRWMFTAAPGGPYQPLAWLSYAADFALWGPGPLGVRATNLLLHALIAALLCALARRLLHAEFPSSGRLALETAAFFSSALFAAHPLRAEVVCWASQRRELLCALFYLGALHAYLGAEGARGPERRRALLACGGLFLLALASKAMAVTFPVALLLLDWRAGKRGRLREKIPFFLLAFGAGLWALVCQAGERAGLPLEQHGFVERAAQAAYGFWFYLAKTFWPIRLSPLYPLDLPLDPARPVYLSSALGLAAAAAAAWRDRRRRPAWVAAAAFYGITLAPVSGLLQSGLQIAADRYSYLASMPLGILAAGAALRARRRLPAAALAGALVLALGAASRRQARAWTDDLSLWSRALAAGAESAAAYNNLGKALASRGRTAEAVPLFERSLALDPGCVAAQDRLAASLRSGIPLPDARAILRDINERPVCRNARFNLMTARASLGETEAPEAYFRMILLLEPENRDARANLARLAGRRRR